MKTHGSQKGFQNVVIGIRCCHFLGLFPHSILDLFMIVYFKIVMILESLLVPILHRWFGALLEALEPCLLMAVWCFS